MFIKRSKYDVLINQLEFYKKLNEEKSKELYNTKMLLEHYQLKEQKEKGFKMYEVTLILSGGVRTSLNIYAKDEEEAKIGAISSYIKNNNDNDRYIVTAYVKPMNEEV